MSDHRRLSPLLLAAIPLLLSCEDGPTGLGPPVVRVGAAVSMTGALSVEGNEVLRGYQLWAEWVNEDEQGIAIGGDRYLVELIVEDDGSDPATTAELLEGFIDDDLVDFLLGPYGSAATLTATEVAEERGVLIVESGGAAESIFERGYQNNFGVLTSASSYTQAALEALAGLGAATVAVVYEEGDAFSESVADGAAFWAEEYDLELLLMDSYPLGDPSGAVEDAQALAPDVFIAGGHYADAVQIAEAAEDLGFDPPAMLLTVGPSIPAFVTDLGATAEHILGPTQWESSMSWEGVYLGSAADYAALYEAQFGQPPAYQAAGATAAGLALQAALEAAGSLDTDAVRAALRALDITTFYGPIRFDATGRNVAKPMGVTQVQDGEIVVVAPPEIAVAALIYGGGGS